MVGLTSLLVIALAVLINADAVLSEVCGVISIGDTSGSGIELQKTSLQPGQVDWQVKIPPIPQCPNPVGGKAIVCDADVLPNGNYVDLSSILVHRVGNVQGLGSVTPTVYCGSNNQLWWPHQQNNPSVITSSAWNQSPLLSNSPLLSLSKSPQPSLSLSPLTSFSQSPLLSLSQSTVTSWNQSPLKLTAIPL